MKRIYQYLICPIIYSAFLTILLYPSAAYAETCEQWVAKVVSVQGSVEVQKVGETQWQPVKLNDKYCPGDVIRVQERSRADIALVNQPVIRLDQNTTITLGGLIDEGTSLVDLLKGAAHFFSRLPRNLEVHTAFVNAGVEGTEFFISVEENQTFISIFEGKVLASNEAGKLALTSGQAAVAEAGKAPVLGVVVRPRDAVQWALYYPPVIYVPPEKAPAQEDTDDPHFLANRASLLLAVGRVDEAGADIEQALRLDPNYSDAFALQTIIAIVKNEKEKALNLAQKAVEAGPESATARIALSYAQQASFDLESARASLEEAVKQEPENALAWARLAELWSSFGNLDKSLEAAQKAVALSPNLSRTQTVLGFAYLTKVKTTEAKGAFEKAIELDQADPLPRLGLGLAKIREGDLKEGGRDIEVAASLDPNNSLVRSYLGKVYFEEKRTGLDVREYAIAKELDPNDPTPWFYDAITKQTTNRPVEALRDLQKAIELNDNRAVYRSKLLLDSDLAARSASLARIYSDLGFQQRALVEGWNSVDTDPSNHTAHRFLADTYSVLPRHEIARVSELLQSQLLQPNNITPIQPALAESNLFLISASGAASTSFNEFNPLFNRDQATLQASGLAGSNSTWGGEGVVSGIYSKLSLSSGYTHFETDGWRANSDQNDDIASIFAQYEFSYKTSIQAEYRYRDSEKGDVQLRFFEDDFLPDRRQKDEIHSSRIGFRHSFTPDSIILGNFSDQDGKRSFEDQFVPGIVAFDLEGNDDATGGELQYLFRSDRVNIVTGAGYFSINSIDDTVTTITPPFPPITIINTATVNNDTDHANAYLYSYLKFPYSVTWTIGASGDFFDSENPDGPDADQFNPKFGVTWNPFTGTTLRAAAFRVLKRTLITDQTIEPTQVAGFNQFFDDFNATDSWRFGGAWDQKFSQSIYGGIEYTYKDMKVPWTDFSGPTPAVKESDWEEHLGRAYFFWAPINWLSLTAEYLYEKLKRDPSFTFGVKDLKTHYVPLGVNFFCPLGLNLLVKGTYVSQKGDFQRQGAAPGVFESGKDDFWLVDAGLSYRLPKRYGFLTVGVSNLFDEKFQYYDSDIDNPRIQPERYIFAKLTLSIP
jgi:tetratricopeptide (TPR) repeat protein